MSNTITAFFKGRVGVAESVYQHDYGRVLVIDGINLPAVFEAHFSTLSEDDAITVIGQNNRVAIPDSCINKTGIVTVYIYLHSGENDGETEYVIRFAVVRRAKPDYDATDEEKTEFETAVQTALAMLQNPKKVNQPLDEHNQVNYGIAGQLLRTKGDGSTEWVNEGLPTDEQTSQAVSDWLNDHPEATTTVQDGSLTEAKFTDTLKFKTIKDYVTPQMFGAVADGITDDTQAIQDAVNYIYHNNITGGVLYFPNGIYAISEPIKFYLNKNFDLSKNEVTAGDGAITPEIVFCGESNSNVIIKAVSSCEYLFEGHASSINWLQNVTFKHLTLDGNEIAMSSVDMQYANYAGYYTYFIDCYIVNFTEAGIKYIATSNPSLAIWGENTRITIEKCKIRYNDYGVILAGDDFNIIETTIQNNKSWGAYINGSVHRMSFVRCKIQYNGLDKALFSGGQIQLNCSGQNLLFENCYFENKSSIAAKNDTGVIVIKATSAKSFQELTISNCYFNLMSAAYFINYVNDYKLTLQNIHIINNTIRNFKTTTAYLIYVSDSNLGTSDQNASYVSRYLEERGTRIEHLYGSSQDSKFYLYNGFSYEGYGGSIKSSYGAWSPNTSENLRGCIPTIFAGAFSDSLSQAMPKVGNYSVEKSENTGEYNVTFDDPINVAGGTFNYYPVFAKVDSSNPLHHAYVKNQSVNGFTIVTGTFDNTYSEFTPTFLRFSFMCAFVTKG